MLKCQANAGAPTAAAAAPGIAGLGYRTPPGLSTCGGDVERDMRPCYAMPCHACLPLKDEGNFSWVISVISRVEEVAPR